MPKEIKILLPEHLPDEVFDIQIQSSSKKCFLNYRFELLDLDKDNPENLSNVDFLKQKIKAYSDYWEVAEIFAQENNKIPILFKQKKQ